MAFAVTLAAVYDTSRDAITLPKLIRRLGERSVHYALAHSRRVPMDSIAANVGIAARRFARIQALPIYESLKELRHSVVAHHGPDTTSHGATVRPLNRLMVRTVVLVDHLGVMIKGEPEGNDGLARIVLRQSAAVWSHGMDADPYGDLQQRTPDEPSGR